jgi:hypothetical protein
MLYYILQSGAVVTLKSKNYFCICNGSIGIIYIHIYIHAHMGMIERVGGWMIKREGKGERLWVTEWVKENVSEWKKDWLRESSWVKEVRSEW